MAFTALPVAPTPSDSPQVFNTRGFALVAALALFVTEGNALQADVTAKAADVTTKAADVTTKASDVTTKAADVTTKAADVVTKHGQVTTMTADVTARQADVVTRQADVTAKQTAAATSATNAATSENNAMIYATKQLIASSTTSLTPSVGSKTFTMEANKAFVIGQYISLTSVSAQDHKMGGTLTAYDRNTGVATITVAAGELYGTLAKTDWAIGLSAQGSLVSLNSLYRGAYLLESNGGTIITNKRYRGYTGTGAVTMTLPTPANCAAGDEVFFSNHNAKWATNALTISCPANVTVFNPLVPAAESSLVCDTNDFLSVWLFCSNHTGTAAEWTVMT